ncbi:MAG: DUF4352 domain-containing protein [Acidimicrobiales bacterium]
MPVGAVQALVTQTGIPYDVQLDAVIDPARGASTFDVPPSGTRFVAAVFAVTNKGTSVYTNDANNDASVIGSNDQQYTASFYTLSGCTNFDYGLVNLQPGAQLTGCVSFAIPNGVGVSRVQWASTSGFGSTVVWANTPPPSPAPSAPAPTPPSPAAPQPAVVSMVATPSGGGYWLADAAGDVNSYGNAQFDGSMGGKPLDKPIVGMAATPTGNGYWEVASDGGLFSFGNAQFYGSMGGKPLNEPVVGMTASATGAGYREVAADGGLFSFGNAQFYGSMGGKPLDKPIVSMTSSPTGKGYWEVASDGGIFSFGNAQFYGSRG